MRTKKSGYFSMHLPFMAVILYLFSVIVIFWAGPLEWPVTNTIELAVFQASSLVIIVMGYSSVSPSRIPKGSGVNLRPLFYIGVISVILLQIPVTLTYTGKYPWDVIQSIMDQRQTYEDMLDQLSEGQGTRLIVPLLRAIVSPLFYAALGYGLLHFKSLRMLQRVLLLVAILCPVNLSLLRGTDKEIADVLIILSGFLLVSYYRKRLNLTHDTSHIKGSQGKWMSLLAVVAVCLFLAAFSFKKLERLGGNIDFCFGDGVICADYSGPILSSLPDFVAFGYAMVDFYLTNGFYGLSLALQQPFDSTLGIGHSAAFLGLYERFTGDPDLFTYSFIGKISNAGWDHRYYWPTIFTWLANDVGFFGSLLIVGWMARWFRQSWSDAVYSSNDLAAIVFVFLCIAFVYLPANHQLAQTLDSYFASIIALIAWKFTRKRLALHRNLDGKSGNT
jgi:hypothetical protein